MRQQLIDSVEEWIQAPRLVAERNTRKRVNRVERAKRNEKEELVEAGGRAGGREETKE